PSTFLYLLGKHGSFRATRVPVGDRTPAADKGLQEPPTTLPALLRTMVGADLPCNRVLSVLSPC
ncbi:hypothetical protein, partial [Sphingobacterium sp. UBA6317]|uniref:hypothetical protein n=1 Tax=Sphingobacterium sp. UBA6317 TaxID=1947509 RepID=UPI00257D2D93